MTTIPNLLQRMLDNKNILLADGATGTNLFAMGLQTGDSPELWNIDHPDRIEKLHSGFIDAGSDIILTNSFGGTHFRLGLHQAQERVWELNAAAAGIARGEVAKVSHDVIVAGSMGPTGEILEPNGPISIAQAAEAFAEQAQALQAGGADILWLETLSSAEEIRAAVQGASTTDLPIVLTVSIDTNGRTMMGMTASDVITLTASLPQTLSAVGTNCGVGAAELVAAVANFRRACDSQSANQILVAKANCGIPEFVNGEIVYNGTPEIMRNYATLAADAGARIVGGCCGTTTAHVRAMRQAIDSHTPTATPDLETIITTLGEISKGAQAQLRGEMGVAAASATGKGARQSRRRRKKV